MRTFIRAITAFDIAGFAATKLLPYTLVTRGCWAVGGEWLLIAGLAWAGWQIGGFVADLTGARK